MTSTSKHLRLIAFLLAALSSATVANAEWRSGIGVLGDSYSDEYQFYPPHRTTARNWVEILAERRGLNFGELTYQSRGEPRNQGYAYNWARSDATTEDMIRTGQHTGLAGQVSRGEVNLVAVFVGGNDFINAMKSPNPEHTFTEVGPRAEANLQLAVETILAASPNVKVIISTVPDIRHLPEFRKPLSEGRISRSSADAATATIWRYNTRIRLMTRDSPRIAVMDCDLVSRLADRMYPESLMVAGHRVVRAAPSNEPDHLFLADVRHLGTVGQGLFARLFIATVDTKFQAGIADLREDEIFDWASTLFASQTKALSDASAGSVAGLAAAEREKYAEGPMSSIERTRE
jgi:phospholipase/lecithinase/hemolysin